MRFLCFGGEAVTSAAVARLEDQNFDGISRLAMTYNCLPANNDAPCSAFYTRLNQNYSATLNANTPYDSVPDIDFKQLSAFFANEERVCRCGLGFADNTSFDCLMASHSNEPVQATGYRIRPRDSAFRI